MSEKSGSFNEKMKVAVSEGENPFTARDRDNVASRSLTGVHAGP